MADAATDDLAVSTARSRPSFLARIPTGAKLFLILSIALLPLALIAMVATLQTTRLADAQSRARLRVTADEIAHAIAIELLGDAAALRVAVNALGTDPADAQSCARAQGVFAQQSTAGTRFLIVDRAGKALCGQPFDAHVVAPRTGAPVNAAIIPGKGLVLALAGPGRSSARAFFPVEFLARLGIPSTRASLYASALTRGDQSLILSTIAGHGPLDRLETAYTNVGIAGLSLRTDVRAAAITYPFVVALLLPLLMWAAAASIGWFVVDRLLIRPLRDLRASVATYTPGEVIDPATTRAFPTQEIRDLGETFRTISATVAQHEAGLAEGLVRQTKLTREVHHRVKNNLQVIASLINLHARGASSPDAVNAYASIQRRVDALAVVHRNHFADVEENRGLNLRAMIGELAASIRATAAGIGITIDMDALLVNQDVAVAVAFLVTETVELAMGCDPAAQIRLSLKAADADNRAVLRMVSRALVESEQLQKLVAKRYGRVMEGLSRQLRAPLHHDPLTGAYEITIMTTGRD
jgi:two-component sensor histidine kinase